MKIHTACFCCVSVYYMITIVVGFFFWLSHLGNNEKNAQSIFLFLGFCFFFARVSVGSNSFFLCLYLIFQKLLDEMNSSICLCRSFIFFSSIFPNADCCSDFSFCLPSTLVFVCLLLHENCFHERLIIIARVYMNVVVFVLHCMDARDNIHSYYIFAIVSFTIMSDFIGIMKFN